MNTVSDPIMDEIYAIRHEISAASGHDVSAYFNLVQKEKREAASLGMTYFDYCFAQLNKRHEGDLHGAER